MKAEKKFIIFGIIILFASACFLIYKFPGGNEMSKSLIFPGDVIVKKSSTNVKPLDNYNVSVVSKTLEIEGSTIHILSVGDKPQVPVLFLHGMAFNAKTWEELDTLSVFGKLGYHAIAVDLPGYGYSEKLDVKLSPDLFLDKLVEMLGVEKPVIVSPSMSGKFSIPFILKHPDKLSGYVPISPVIDSKYSGKSFEKLKVPTMIVFGENDKSAKSRNVLLTQIPKSKLKMIPNGQHACYLNNPELFHSMLKDFVASLK